MTKKTIILLLIAIIFINTIFWISLISNTGWGSLIEGLRMNSAPRVINLLAITDAVLVAVSFMIIHLYKKE